MNYSELTATIEETTENSYEASQLATFVQQAEQFIFNTVQIPDLRKNQTGTVTSSNPYLTVPSDYLYTYSLAVIDGSGNYTLLLNKDVNFIREAYPLSSSTGIPKHYAQFDKDSFIMGPTPDSNYTVELHYGYYPESIVTASNTWLGDNFDIALLNASLYEAARFMKSDPDIMQTYKNMRDEAILLLKGLGDGKLRQDTYRSGQVTSQIP
jgi:hypothetical protein